MKRIKNLFLQFKNSNASKASMWYFAGSLVETGIVVLLMPVFTRLLSTHDYGLVNTYNSWVAIIGIFISLSASMSVRSAKFDFRGNLDNYCQSLFSLYGINFLILAVLLTGVYFLFDLKLSYTLLMLCLWQGMVSAVTATVNQRYLMEEKYRQRTSLMVAPVILSTVIGIVAVILLSEEKYYGRIVPNIIVITCVAMYFVIQYSKRTREIVSIKREYIRYALAISLPLIFHQLSLNVLSSMDRTMITMMRNASETGLYSVVYNIGIGVTIVQNVFDSVWIPWFYNHMNSGDTKSINIAYKQVLVIMTAFISSYMLGAPELLKLLASKDYWGGMVMLPPIVLASFFIFLNTFPVNLEYYTKKTKRIASNTIVAAVANLVLNFIFIPLYGATAAAYTTVAAYALLTVLQTIEGKKINKALFSWYHLGCAVIFMAGMTFVAYMLMESWLLRWILAVFVFATALVLVFFLLPKTKEDRL